MSYGLDHVFRSVLVFKLIILKLGSEKEENGTAELLGILELSSGSTKRMPRIRNKLWNELL